MALVGNPSDGAGGAVLALTIAEFAAVSEVTSGDGVSEPDDLITAAVEAFPGPASDGLAVTCETTIPMQVGLGGSSAIVIATMRALAEHHDTRIDRDDLAAAALRAERDILGIAAGPQDRYAQAHGGLVLMDFADGASVEHLDPTALPPLFLAYRPEGAASSGVTHSSLERRADATAEPMQALAELARDAGDRLRSGDRGIGPLMDDSFDLRAEMVDDLDPDHVAMVQAARAHGASANYTGSGGAISGTVPDGDAWPALEAALKAQGCEVLWATAG